MKNQIHSFIILTAFVLAAAMLLPIAQAESPTEGGSYIRCVVHLVDGNNIEGFVRSERYYIPPHARHLSHTIFTAGQYSWGSDFWLVKEIKPIGIPRKLYTYTPESRIKIRISGVENIELKPHKYDLQMNASNMLALPQEKIDTLQNEPKTFILRDDGDSCPQPKALVSYSSEHGEPELNNIWLERVRGVNPNRQHVYPFEDELEQMGIILISLPSS